MKEKKTLTARPGDIISYTGPYGYGFREYVLEIVPEGPWVGYLDTVGLISPNDGVRYTRTIAQLLERHPDLTVQPADKFDLENVRSIGHKPQG